MQTQQIRTVYAPDNSFHIEDEFENRLLGCCFDGAAAMYRVSLEPEIVGVASASESVIWLRSIQAVQAYAFFARQCRADAGI